MGKELKTFIVREWPAPAMNAKHAKKINVSCCRLAIVKCHTKKEAKEKAYDNGWGAGRKITISTPSKSI